MNGPSCGSLRGVFKALMVWFISDEQKLLHICPHSDCSKGLWVWKMDHDFHWRYLINTHKHTQLSASLESQRCLSDLARCLHSSLSEHREFTRKHKTHSAAVWTSNHSYLFCCLTGPVYDGSSRANQGSAYIPNHILVLPGGTQSVASGLIGCIIPSVGSHVL